MCAAALNRHSGLVISTVQGMSGLIAKMQLNKIVREQYLSKLNDLQKQLSSIEGHLSKYPKLQKDTKIITELKEVDEALRKALNECDKLCKTRMHSHQDSAELQLRNVGSLLEQIKVSVELAIQLIGSEMIYLNQEGLANVVAEPDRPTDVIAEPDGQCSNIRWKENANREVTKYEILLESTTDTDSQICFTSETCELRVTEEMKSWEGHSIRVRAMNSVGYGPWSDPIATSPPTQPQLKDNISYNATDYNSLCIQVKCNEQQSKQQVTHCILEQTTTKKSKPYAFSKSTNMVKMVITIPPGCNQCNYCIKFKNQQGESIPTEELNACAIIASLIPGKPRKVRSIDGAKTTTEVWITWEQPKRNAGAVHRYIVEKRQLGSPWEEVPPEAGMDRLEGVLRDLNNRPPEFASQLYLQSATQNEDQVSYRVVKNLQQDTTYEFKISAVNEKKWNWSSK